MGMIANYQYLPDNELEQIKCLSNQEDDLLGILLRIPLIVMISNRY